MNLREELANYAHESWSGWIEYMFKFGEKQDDGSLLLRADKVERWKRQAETPYGALSSEERDSDRVEADTILTIVGGEQEHGY